MKLSELMKKLELAKLNGDDPDIEIFYRGVVRGVKDFWHLTEANLIVFSAEEKELDVKRSDFHDSKNVSINNHMEIKNIIPNTPHGSKTDDGYYFVGNDISGYERVRNKIVVIPPFAECEKETT